MQLPLAKVVLVDCREELKKYNININDYVKQTVAGDGPTGTFPCRECSLVLRTKRFRMIHETRYHSANSTLMHHQCTKCQKRFYTVEDLDEHFLIRHSNQKYQCEMCSFKCKFRGRMQHHLDTKHRTSAKKYPCEYCDKKFFLPQLLKSHIVRHHKSESQSAKQKAYTCRLCNHTMIRRDNIIGHMQRHNDITDHKCRSCDLRFLTVKDLVTHTKVHNTDTEQISCCFCDFQSPNSLKMDRHIQEVHIDPKKVFSCSQCGKEFHSKGNLRYHENIKHRLNQKQDDLEFDDIFKGTTLDSDEDDKPGTSNSHMSDESLEELQKQINSINVNEEDKDHEELSNFMPINGDSEIEEDTPVVISIAEAEKLLSIPEKVPPVEKQLNVEDEVPRKENEKQKEEPKGEPKDVKKVAKAASSKSRRTLSLEERTCPFCQVVMSRRREMLSHYARHDEIKDHRCSFCPLRFLARTRLSEHELIHKSKPGEIPKMYKCSMCSYTTKSRFYMRSHNKNIHKVGPGTPTPVFTDGYENSNGNAEKVDDKKKTFKCEICGKVLKTEYTLKTHWNIHKSNFKCLTCGKCFSIKERLEKHIEKHDESKDLQCTFCPLRFLTGAEMELHMGLEHEQANVKVITCPHCPYKTSIMRATNLRCHLRNVHKLPNPFQIIRELKFGTMNEDERKLVCTICRVKLPTENALKLHQDKKHGKKKIPMKEKKVTETVKEKPVEVHKNETTTEVATSTQPTSILDCFFECDLCEIFLESINTMREHFVVQHNNLKPYKCEICENRFPTWPILRRHQKLSHKSMGTYIPERIIIQQQRKRRRTPSTSSSSSSSSGSSTSTSSSSNSSSSSSSSLTNASHRHTGESDVSVPKAVVRTPMRGKSLPPSLPKKTVSLKVMTLTNKINDHEYQCDICRQIFDNEEAFRSHFQYHNHLNPFKCELCSKRFETWVSLRRHQGIMHKGYRNNCL